MISWYTNKLIERPYVTKCITSFITFGLGDVICQLFEKKSNKNKKFDYIRAFRQGSFGVIMTPYLHLQFNHIIPKYFANGKLPILKILAYDQTVNASVFIFAFFTYIDYFSGIDPKTSLQHTLVKFPSTIVANWQIWPMAQILNFTIVPAPYRVFFANIVGLFWNVYLSFVQNVKGKQMIEQTNQKGEIEKH